MPFSPARHELTAERKAIVLAVVLFLNLLLISSQIILKNRRSLLGTVLGNLISPVQIACQQTSDFFINQLRHYLFLRRAYQKYVEVKRENTRLILENFRMKSQLWQMRALESVRGKFKNYRLVNVIAVDINFPFNTLTIDQGQQAGITENLTVVNLEGELVGCTVKPITAFAAAVRLITASGTGTGAYMQSNMLEGVLSGNGSALCSFKYLLEGKPLRLGDRVISSGTDLLFLPYVPIGQVLEIQKDYLMQNVTVKPFFVSKPLKQLLVLTNG